MLSQGQAPQDVLNYTSVSTIAYLSPAWPHGQQRQTLPVQGKFADELVRRTHLKPSRLGDHMDPPPGIFRPR